MLTLLKRDGHEGLDAPRNRVGQCSIGAMNTRLRAEATLNTHLGFDMFS